MDARSMIAARRRTIRKYADQVEAIADHVGALDRDLARRLYDDAAALRILEIPENGR